MTEENKERNIKYSISITVSRIKYGENAAEKTEMAYVSADNKLDLLKNLNNMVIKILKEV